MFPGTGKKRSASLRARYLFAGAVVLLVGLGATGIALERSYANGVERNIRDRLEGMVNQVLASIQEDQDELTVNAVLDSRLQQPESGYYSGLISTQYEWQSASSVGELKATVPELELGSEYYRSPGTEQRRYVYALSLGWETSSGMVIPITVWSSIDRWHFTQEVSGFRTDLWRWLLGVATILLLLQAIAGWLGMQPLQRVSRQIRAIEQGNRSSLDDDYPVELKPLTDNLNALLSSELAGQQRYRIALGNLAHGMKTPLAVLQSVMEKPNLHNQDKAQAQDAIVELHGVMRYQLERAASAARRTISEPLAISPLVDRLIGAMEKVYADQKLSITAQIDEDCYFYGEQRDFMELAGNLIDNACKYSNGKVEIKAQSIASETRRPGMLFKVDDNGPGVNHAEFEQLLQRGMRGDEKADGHGLGLAIVAEIADAYQARLKAAASNLGGLQVLVEFPGF